MTLGDEAAAASTRYSRKPVVPAQQTETSSTKEESTTSETETSPAE